jgi:hypothetical protein
MDSRPGFEPSWSIPARNDREKSTVRMHKRR